MTTAGGATRLMSSAGCLATRGRSLRPWRLISATSKVSVVVIMIILIITPTIALTSW